MPKSAEQIFIDYLRKSGLSVTPQRKIIVETFLETEGHFTAEDLSSLVRKRAADIGQATVYRTLKLLVDSGLADHFDPGNGVTLYEHAYGHAHHDHCICVRCGAKIEICDPVIEQQQERVARKHGFELTSHRMYLFGVCPGCRSDE